MVIYKSTGKDVKQYEFKINFLKYETARKNWNNIKGLFLGMMND
jgi:hypothetical protein